MNLDKLDPPPPDASFAITNVMGDRAVLWVRDGDGLRHFWCRYRTSDTSLPDDIYPEPFRVRQALILFESGWSVSIIWGSASYSTNHDATMFARSAFTETPEVVEVAVMDRDGAMVGGDVLGYVGAEGALAIIAEVATWPSGAMPVEVLWPESVYWDPR